MEEFLFKNQNLDLALFCFGLDTYYIGIEDDDFKKRMIKEEIKNKIQI